MAELANFPMISQRDGDVNQDFDCVPTSIAACMQWLTGQQFRGGEIKDAVYGAGYTGGTAATAYVDYCKAHGVILAPVDGNGDQLVAALQSAIVAGHPALITEPDPYLAGWTHVCAAYKCDSGSITVMDPWIDQPVTKSNADWAAQLQFNQIWTLEKAVAMLDITTVSNYFKDLGNQVWQCIQTNAQLGHGILNYYCSAGQAPFFGLTLFGLPRTGEIPVIGHPGVVLQVFERALLCYDPAHVIDLPPGAGSVYPLHLESGPGLARLQLMLPGLQSANVADAIAIVTQLRQTSDAALAKVLADLQPAP